MSFFSNFFKKTVPQKSDDKSSQHRSSEFTCSKCGKKGDPIRRGVRITMGTVDALSSRIMQCPVCSQNFCGGCTAVVDQHGDARYKCPKCSVGLQPL